MQLKQLSYYAKKLYSGCPEAYRNSYVERRFGEDGDKRNAFEGSIWHALMEDWFKTGTFDEAWIYANIKPYIKKFLATGICNFRGPGDKKKAEETIGLFIENGMVVIREENLINRACKAEETLRVLVDGVDIMGRIDLVAQGPLGVYDWKGVKSIDSLDKEQLGYYKYLVTKTYGAAPEKCAFVLGYFGQLFLLGENEWPIDKLEEEFGRVIEGIRADKFDPTPGQACRFCKYANVCEFVYDRHKQAKCLLEDIANAERCRATTGEGPEGYHRIKI